MNEELSQAEYEAALQDWALHCEEHADEIVQHFLQVNTPTVEAK